MAGKLILGDWLVTAATTSAIYALAIRTGAPVVPVFALPVPGGRYRMIYEHAVEPPSGSGPEAIHEFTQRCAAYQALRKDAGKGLAKLGKNPTPDEMKKHRESLRARPGLWFGRDSRGYNGKTGRFYFR